MSTSKGEISNTTVLRHTGEMLRTAESDGALDARIPFHYVASLIEASPDLLMHVEEAVKADQC